MDKTTLFFFVPVEYNKAGSISLIVEASSARRILDKIKWDLDYGFR